MSSCLHAVLNFLGWNQAPAKANNQTNHLTRLWRTHSSELIEIVFSPLKYAAFSMVGSSGLRWSSMSLSSSLPAVGMMGKAGCVGGMIMAVFYLVLLVSRSPAHKTRSRYEDPVIAFGWKHTARVVFDETFYSSVATILGAAIYIGTGSSTPIDLLPYATAGSLGPPILVAAFYALLGAACSIRWTYNKAMDWYTGYL